MDAIQTVKEFWHTKDFQLNGYSYRNHKIIKTLLEKYKPNQKNKIIHIEDISLKSKEVA